MYFQLICIFSSSCKFYIFFKSNSIVSMLVLRLHLENPNWRDFRFWGCLPHAFLYLFSACRIQFSFSFSFLKINTQNNFLYSSVSYALCCEIPSEFPVRLSPVKILLKINCNNCLYVLPMVLMWCFVSRFSKCGIHMQCSCGSRSTSYIQAQRDMWSSHCRKTWVLRFLLQCFRY